VQSALREREQDYRDLFEQAIVAYVSVGTDGRIKKVNQRAAELFGCSVGELTGRLVFDLYANTANGKPKAHKVFERFLAGQESRGEELECCAADGTQIWISLSVKPIRDAQGHVEASRSTLVDITDRKKVEAALRDSQERLSSILESAMDAMVTVDEEERIVLINVAAERVFRCAAAQVIGRPLGPFLSEAFRSTLANCIRAFAQRGSARRYMSVEGLTAFRADGEEFPIEATLSQGELGGRNLFTIILREMDERQRAEAELRKLQLANLYLQKEIQSQRNSQEGAHLLNSDDPKILWLPADRSTQPRPGTAAADCDEGVVARVQASGSKPYGRVPSSGAGPIGAASACPTSGPTRTATTTHCGHVNQADAHRQEIVGSSPAMLALLRNIEQVALTDATVLICGETGTGKELIARAIHDRGARSELPLVKVDCGAISAGLVESELFGHMKGAFTGAIERRIGRFELADGGTIFLDEVGDLPLETQVKLLRVLQDQEFEAVGSSRSVRVDVRVIAATNRDLGEAMKTGHFRSDLFYRLNVFPLDVPPLRDRRPDIPKLAMFFLERFSKKFGKRIDKVSQTTMDLLVAYGWPGNIRELQNIIERAVVLSHGSVLTLNANLLPAEVSEVRANASRGAGDQVITSAGASNNRDTEWPGPPSSTSLKEVERSHILTILQKTAGLIEGPSGAARILGLSPSTLRGRMKKLGIKRNGHQIQ
jgi:PAS domain S-box-containing protein